MPSLLVGMRSRDPLAHFFLWYLLRRGRLGHGDQLNVEWAHGMAPAPRRTSRESATTRFRPLARPRAARKKKLGWEAVKPGELDGLHLKAVIPDGGQLFFEELGDLPVRLNPGIWEQISVLHQLAAEERRKAESARSKIAEMAKNLDAEAKKAKTKELETAMRAARKREWYERCLTLM